MPKGLCGMRKNVLVVAQQIELRARMVRVLHSAGYGTELAGNQKRALELAARKDIHAAIVVQSSRPGRPGAAVMRQDFNTDLGGAPNRRDRSTGPCASDNRGDS